MPHAWFRSAALTAIALTGAAAADYIWIEGENPATDTVERHNWYSAVIDKELSGGDYLAHFDKKVEPTATYRFEAEAGTYQFWLRANPAAGAKMSYQLNDGEWQEVPFGEAVDKVNIAKDGKPDMRYIAWIDCGEVELSGQNTLTFTMTSKNHNHGAIDCLVFTQEPFNPSGQLKPGAKLGWADEGKWAFEPDRDTFSDEAAIDLRSLNEDVAGENGFIAVDANGDFVNGAGEPIRFWAVNTYVQKRKDMDQLREHAKWLAKRGVNMVRHHGDLTPRSGNPITATNIDGEVGVRAAQMLVAAMKEEGIYTTISPYWGSHTYMQESWKGQINDDGNGKLRAIVFWDETLQDAYKGWLRDLYASENPYTGIPLAEDPAVGIIQLQNEDSVLFWTMQKVQGEQRQKLRTIYGDWLSEKYGSIAQAQSAWGGGADHKADDSANGEVGLYSIWHLTEGRGNASRMADQMEFYSKLMYDFNKEIEDFLRNELGCKQLINAGNWKTADQVKMLDAERYAYDANEVIAANKYYGSGHKGPKSGYKIMTGDWFANKSATQAWRGLPLNVKQIVGKPFLITESQWVPPNRYQSEAAFLVAAYQSLTGVDAYYWFCSSSVQFDRPIAKWQISTPTQAGMFPAAALMFRKGYIQQGDPVVVERRKLEDVFAMRDPVIAEDLSFDPNRDQGLGNQQSDIAGSATVPEAFLVGPVQVQYLEDGNAENEITDLRPYVDTQKGTITSITEEITLNHQQGWTTVNAPKAQGVTGFLQQHGAFVLDDVSIDSQNEYATIFAVSLDDQPLATADQVLVQVGTVARPYGFEFKPKNHKGAQGYEITKLGSVPWNVENTEAEFTIANPNLRTATALDANMVPMREVETRSAGGKLSMTLPKDAMYILLQ